MDEVEKEEFNRRFGKCSQAIRIDRLIGWVACREWRDSQAQTAQINEQMRVFIQEWLDRQGNDNNYMTEKANAALAASRK